MRFKVPQYIDIEDKIVGPLTAKQFLWLLGAGVILFIFYQVLDLSLFLALAVIIIGIAAALAFFRPYGQSLIGFLGHISLYGTKNKQYVWQRNQRVIPQGPPIKIPSKPTGTTKKANLPEKQVEELAKILDSQGNEGFFKNPNGTPPKNQV